MAKVSPRKRMSLTNQMNIAFIKWCKLRVWKADMSNIKFKVRKRTNGNHGTGQADNKKIVVTIGKDRFENYSTLLHEMAHTALGRRRIEERYDHDVGWQDMLVQATEAVLGGPIDVPEFSSYTDLDKFITSQFRKRRFKIF